MRNGRDCRQRGIRRRVVVGVGPGLGGSAAGVELVQAAISEAAIEVEGRAVRRSLADHLRTSSPGVARLFRQLLEINLRILLGLCGRAASGEHPEWERAEALEWITSDDESYVFSFRVVCMALGLDPDYVRSRALARKEELAA